MAHSLPVGPMTVEEYFEFEARSVVRHEYLEGEVYARSGVTRRHNDIAGNVYIRLRTAARGGPCRVHISDVKLRIGRVIYYPDVMVACGPEPTDERIEDAPCVVIEVTSYSTEHVDRREKLMVYKRIPALAAYLIIDQDQRRVDRYWRDGDATWRHELIVDAGAIPIPCRPLPSLELTLDDVYEGVRMPSPDERLRLREEEAVYDER